jgi:hypothetical protein
MESVKQERESHNTNDMVMNWGVGGGDMSCLMVESACGSSDRHERLQVEAAAMMILVVVKEDE